MIHLIPKTSKFDKLHLRDRKSDLKCIKFLTYKHLFIIYVNLCYTLKASKSDDWSYFGLVNKATLPCDIRWFRCVA